MLMLNFHPGDTFTFRLPDGTQGHAKLVNVTDRTVRMAFAIPDELRITRDTTGAVRAFEDFKK